MNISKLRLQIFTIRVLASLAILCPGLSIADPSSDVKFTLYRRRFDDCIFRIKNKSAQIVELDSLAAPDSGSPFQPAYPRLEGYTHGELADARTLGELDVLPHSYSLRPGETLYFRLSFSDDADLKNSTSARIRLGNYLSSAFPVRKVSAAEVDFREYGTNAANVLFRIQNNNETAIPLPSLDPGEDKDEPFAVAEFEVQMRKGRTWIQTAKTNSAATNPSTVWLRPKDAIILKAPKASFGEFPAGSVLQLRIGDFVTKPFEIQ